MGHWKVNCSVWDTGHFFGIARFELWEHLCRAIKHPLRVKALLTKMSINRLVTQTELDSFGKAALKNSVPPCSI